MLRLKKITKIYDVADEKVVALDGVDIEFGKSEFVSILGPSGCGKTTLLNIIGGLDNYTSGELEIAGVSTARYTDRDWDSYRNHSVGFVFQSYNLIPHLTVLSNVELALDLVGEDKTIRTEKALKALEKVGLRNKAYKKPNQLSGGQMQRVAIARALINDPEIILADEPTGALDSETSLQVMAILKEISKTRLVIMVTHNAELAREYSTRIVRLFDGKVTGDSNPYVSRQIPVSDEGEKEIPAAPAAPAQALRIEKGSVSADVSAPTDDEIRSAVKAYVQEIGGVKFAVLTTKAGKLIMPFSGRVKKLRKGDFAEKKAVFGGELAAVTDAFMLSETRKKASRQEEKYKKKPAMRIGTAFRLSLNNLLSKRFRTFLTALAGSIGILGIALVLGLNAGLNSFITRQEVALSSYPITITRSATDYEAAVNMVVSALDGLDGKYDKSKIYVYKVVRQLINNTTKKNEFDKELIKAIREIDPSLYYDIYENYSLNFNVVKRIPSGTNILGEFRTTSDYYMAIDTTSAATGWVQLPSEELVMEQYELIAGSYPKSRNELVLILDGRNQISDINLFFNGLDMESVSLNYKDADDVSGAVFDVDEFIKSQTFRLVGNSKYYVKNGTSYAKNETTTPGSSLITTVNGRIGELISGSYRINLFRGDNTDDSGPSYRYTEALNGSEKLEISGVIKLKDDISVGVLGTSCMGYTPALTDRVISWAHEWITTNEVLDLDSYETDVALSNATRRYGYATVPQSVSIYCRNYDGKSAVKAALKNISDERKAAGKSEITFSDLMSVVLSVVQQFINIITLSLLALTAISLVVSALMIGIITYVSVLERTREIGVLRALGARKVDISRIFNAETVVIGFVSGVLGVVITYLISWPLGAVMASLTGISGLVALPWYYALALVGLSTLLTMLAGLIPATIAKRKDPVKALRAE